jgi:hypothetical protein
VLSPGSRLDAESAPRGLAVVHTTLGFPPASRHCGGPNYASDLLVVLHVCAGRRPPAEFQRCRHCSPVRDDGARPGRAGAVQRYWATRVPRALPRRNQRFAVPFAGIGTDADNGQRTARVEAVQVRDACARRSRGSTHSVGVQPVPQQLVESFCPAVARWHCITDLCRRADRPGRRGRVPAVRKHVGGPSGDPTRLERCRLQARAHRPDEWPFSAQV